MNPSWTGREALLAATGHHFLARFGRGGDDIVGYEDSGTVVWTTGSFADSLGDPLVAATIGAGLSGLTFLDLPRLNAHDAARLFPAARSDSWEIRWTTTAPPERSLEDAVVSLGTPHHAAIDDLLDKALPYTRNRPGDPRIRNWYGIFDGSRLVAVGAERSRHDVGYVAAIAVSPSRQGRGLGAAITAAVTRLLLREFDICALGVMDHNAGAKAAFHHLGYRDRLLRTAIRWGVEPSTAM
jgi:ribosomal protein S18 acetylase RimI-like enzyme